MRSFARRLAPRCLLLRPHCRLSRMRVAEEMALCLRSHYAITACRATPSHELLFIASSTSSLAIAETRGLEPDKLHHPSTSAGTGAQPHRCASLVLFLRLSSRIAADRGANAANQIRRLLRQWDEETSSHALPCLIQEKGDEKCNGNVASVVETTLALVSAVCFTEY